MNEVVEPLPAPDEGRRDRPDRRGRRRRGLGLGRARGVQPRGLGRAPRPGDGTRAAPLLDPRRRRRPPRLRRGRALGREHAVGRAPEDRPAHERGRVHADAPGRALLRRRRWRLRVGGEQSRKGWSGRSRPNGSVLPTIKLPSAVKSLTYADGALWAALGEEGTVVRIDPTTDETREYDLGHSVTSVDVRDGLVAAGVRQSIEDVTRRPLGRRRVGRAEGARAVRQRSAHRARVHVARPGTRRRRCSTTRPARGSSTTRTPRARPGGGSCPRSPRTSPRSPTAGARTRSGSGRASGFSPPSNEEVTAESFRRALERGVELDEALRRRASPSTGEHRRRAGVLRGQGASRLGRLGATTTSSSSASASRSRTCRGSSRRRAAPFRSTRRSSRAASRRPSPRQGPYYLAALTDSLAVLKRNPNYGGSRPQQLDAIVVEFNVAPGEAATRIENGTLDYFLESQNPTLTPGHRGRARRRRAISPDAATTGSSSSPSTTTGRCSPTSACAARCSTRSTAGRSPRRPGGSGLAGDAPALPEHRRVRRASRCTRFAPTSARRASSPAVARRRSSSTHGTIRRTPTPSTGPSASSSRAIGLGMTMLRSDQADSRGARYWRRRRSDLIWGGLSAAHRRPGRVPQGRCTSRPDDANELRADPDARSRPSASARRSHSPERSSASRSSPST